VVRTPSDAWCRSPLCNKVGKDLTLDGVAGLEVELISSELCSPLCRYFTGCPPRGVPEVVSLGEETPRLGTRRCKEDKI
jgi:hypothetical protein